MYPSLVWLHEGWVKSRLPDLWSDQTSQRATRYHSGFAWLHHLLPSPTEYCPDGVGSGGLSQERVIGRVTLGPGTDVCPQRFNLAAHRIGSFHQFAVGWGCERLRCMRPESSEERDGRSWVWRSVFDSVRGGCDQSPGRWARCAKLVGARSLAGRNGATNRTRHPYYTTFLWECGLGASNFKVCEREQHFSLGLKRAKLLPH